MTTIIILSFRLEKKIDDEVKKKKVKKFIHKEKKM
jgi:hypothetical protein